MDFIKQIKDSILRKLTKNKRKKKDQRATQNQTSKKEGSQDDYVQGEEVERFLFYECEMPTETIARIRARQDSLSRMQGVPLGLNTDLEINNNKLHSESVYDFTEESILSRCTLLSAEAFARISEGSGSHEDEGNYLDMSDPPNYDDFMYLRINEPEDSDYINQLDRKGDEPPPSYYEVMRSRR